MKYPPSRIHGLRKMQTLQEGEDSRTYRVRAPDAVHEWLSSMTAEERGQMLAQVYAAQTRSRENADAEGHSLSLAEELRKAQARKKR